MGKVLLLGVTPELADLGADLTAVDRNDNMLKHVWPGDSLRRRACLGDWRNLQLGSNVFSSCIADGSLNAVTYPDEIVRILNGVSEALEPGGRFVCRLYATPDRCESLDDVRAAAMNGGIQSFHALKWRVAMATVAAQHNPNIRVTAILESFERLFPDRKMLTQRCGWPQEIIDTIDVYRDSTDIYCFPAAGQFLSLVPSGFVQTRLVDSGSYELAERCPLLVMDRA
jgi:methyltransferase family protein